MLWYGRERNPLRYDYFFRNILEMPKPPLFAKPIPGPGIDLNKLPPTAPSFPPVFTGFYYYYLGF